MGPPAPFAPPPQSEKDARQQKARRHRSEAAEDKERDATSYLLLKHQNATLATYI
jgi:hypothetical protein